MYLVVGATGILGSDICRLLTAQGKTVRGLVRATSDQAKVDRLRSYGVEIVQGDMCDPTSLEVACKGVSAVISTVSSMPFCYEAGDNDIQRVDKDGVTCLIDAAQSAGVERFIYTSFTMDNDFPLRNVKRAVEGHLKDSGIVYTILRLSYTMDVWFSPLVGFDYSNAKAQIYGSGQNPISWVAFQDVAQFAVESLDNPAAQNATFELGGPEALSPLEVVRIFEEVGGQPFEVQHVPEEVLAEQQQAATDPAQQSFAGLMRWYAKGDPVDMAETLKTFPVELTSVRDYARGVLSAP